MRRHFSSRELFVLRNHIPIDTLIEKHLRVPSKFSEESVNGTGTLCLTHKKFHGIFKLKFQNRGISNAKNSAIEN
jgi:hypothetical protein